ncbi:MAG: PIG-L deacetylase family protein [Bryobacteraceae bacterium]
MYVFPHPDDESFGPAAGIAHQVRSGRNVSLLTLTRGGATRQRHHFGYSVGEMGAVRLGELQRAAKVLELTDLAVLDFPDGGLKEITPMVLEEAVRVQIERVRPAVVVTYPVHGITGHPDHVVTHAVVKRVYCELRERVAPYLKRLAFFTLREAPEGGPIRLTATPAGEIDCDVPVRAEDAEIQHRALDCYETYRAFIETSGIREMTGIPVCYEIFQERYDPPLEDLCDRLM